MRKPTLSQKVLSVICSTTLAFGLMPMPALATTPAEGGETQAPIATQSVAEPMDAITSVKLKETSAFEDGKQYMVVYNDSAVMKSTMKSSNSAGLGSIAVTVDGGTAESTSDMSTAVWTYSDGKLLSSSGQYLYYDKTSSYYTYYTKTSSTSSSTVSMSSDGRIQTTDSYGQTYSLGYESYDGFYFGGTSSSVKVYEVVTCEHANLTEHPAVAPVCGSGNIQYWQCDNCDSLFDAATGGNEIKSTKAAHEFGDPVVTKAAKCTEAGSQALTCTVCNTVETQEIAALGHDFGADGVCTVCSELEPVAGYFTGIAGVSAKNGAPGWIVSDGKLTTENADKSVQTFTITVGEKAGKLSWDYDAKASSYYPLTATIGSTTAWSVTANAGTGSKAIDVNAGDVVTFSFSTSYGGTTYAQWYYVKLSNFAFEANCDHQWGNDVVTPAACTTDGYTTQTCSECNKTQQIDIVTKLGHDYTGVEWSVTKEATCTEDGAKSAKCTRCDDVANETIAALGHDFTKLTNQGEVHDVSCTRCDKPPVGYDVAATTEMVEGGTYVLTFYNGKYAMSCQPWSTNSKTLGTETFASESVSADTVWTWTNGHLVSKDGKYLADNYDSSTWDYYVKLTDDETQAMTFALVTSGNKQYLQASLTDRTYRNCLGAYGSFGGMSMLNSSDSYDKQYVTIYAASAVSPTEAHSFVDGVCACGATVLKGDVNNSGELNIVDAQLAYSYGAKKLSDGSLAALMARWNNNEAMFKAAADVNNDKAVDAVDAFAIQYALHHGGFKTAGE